jgi:endoglucanase
MGLKRFFAGLMALGLIDAAARTQETPPPVKLHEFSAPPLFSFLGWEKKPRMEDGAVRLQAPDARGGFGYNVTLDLTAHADRTPVLAVSAGAANRLKTLKVLLKDADGTAQEYAFPLEGAAAPVTAAEGASLREPGGTGDAGTQAGFDLAKVAQVIVLGDWSGQPVDFVVRRLDLVEPTPAIRAAREQRRKRLEKEAEDRRQAGLQRERRKKELLSGAPHPPDGPEVTHVGAVAPDVLAVTVQAGQHANNQIVPYAAGPGDEIVEEAKDQPRYEVKDGRVESYFQKALFRKVTNQRTRIGLLSPDGKSVFIENRSKGQLLEELAADVPAAYAIQSADDPAYATPVAPAAVYRKGKPNGYSQPLPFLYTISLKLPSPLKEGAAYTVRFTGVNTSKETVTYAHKPREGRSLAVHAIQTGYRPDDPYKRAYFSFWMGVDQDGRHGAVAHRPEAFELVDAAGKAVFAGRAELAKADGAEEQISVHEKQDYTKSPVFRLDFSAFAAPGEYRVSVPGVGTSGPFRIAADAWEAPFKAAMQGILSQRQGIDLGPPACAFRRKRAFHPDDGVQFYQLEIPCQAGQEGVRGKHMLELAKGGPLKRVTGVWGGYQDAGDWDTIGHHLSATIDLLGLYDLNPGAFARMRLALPEEEMKNGLPDILDEALWQMPLWRRLQLPDGGVRGGYGDGWGCYPGETSSMLTYAGVYSADPETTMHYAAAAARAARVLAVHDKKGADEYLESARRAWSWAEAHSKEDDEIYRKVLSFHKELPKTLRHKRALAAVELLAATGEPAFDEAFKQSTELAAKGALYLEQPEADFAYARLPGKLGDPELKKKAVERITAYADHALEFSRKNAFDIITGHRTDMPMIFVSRFFSTPAAGGFAHIYAYELTKKPAYLAAAVQGANYSLGANPDNLSYCSGVGYNPERFPFFVDAQVCGQYPDVPVGHIPYGQGNEGNAMSRGANGWVQTWLLDFAHAKKMVPNWFEWPVNEQFVDFGRYPLHNENCFNQTTVPAACIWFYLAARP